MKKLCFVIMGFTSKKDPITNRTINLDLTYKKIIQPAVQAAGYNCVRADEISDSALIDRSMYALLYCAELVIADISTYNPNAIYELGIRHALKPFSTIIIKEDESTIPFDINHNRMLSYKHLGNEISEKEAKRSVSELKLLIKAISENPTTDSPLYTYIPKIQKPLLSDEEINDIIGDLRNRENTVYALMEQAKELMRNNEFVEAAKKWKKLGEIGENEIFFTQQEAFCTYKSEKPNKINALTNALIIIGKISNHTDTETLGITGAINKNLWKETHQDTYLDTAINLYKKGWNLYQDYYTGENYAQCLEHKALNENDPDMKVYFKIEAKTTRTQIIDIVSQTLEEDDELDSLKWKYATLSNCFRSLQNYEDAEKYESLFLKMNPDEWNMKTYSTSKKEIEDRLRAE
jgi:hypothetical protein